MQARQAPGCRICGQSAPLRPVRGLEQLVLAPAEQGRDQQAREVEVVERLGGEAGGGEQILHRQRRREQQPVDAGDRHALGVEPGDQQRGELAAAADQDQDVLGPQRPAPAFEMEGPVEPGPDLPRQPGGIAAGGVADPALLARFLVQSALLGERQPERHRARPVRMMALMRVRPAAAGRALRGRAPRSPGRRRRGSAARSGSSCPSRDRGSPGRSPRPRARTRRGRRRSSSGSVPWKPKIACL